MSDETLMTGAEDTQVGTQQQTADTQATGIDGGEQSVQQQPGDGNSDGQTTADAKQSNANQEQNVAPEKYEFKAAEGVTFDDAVIGAFSEVAKDLNLSQDAAQKVLDKVAPVLASRQQEQIAAVQAGWAESARADKEFGGDKLNENLGLAKTALDKFGSPELRKLLNDSGMGNHPEVIRAFYKIGKATSQDSIITGQSSARRNPADVLYDNSQK